jgi:hypothetical protein
MGENSPNLVKPDFPSSMYVCMYVHAYGDINATWVIKGEKITFHRTNYDPRSRMPHSSASSFVHSSNDVFAYTYIHMYTERPGTDVTIFQIFLKYYKKI